MIWECWRTKYGDRMSLSGTREIDSCTHVYTLSLETKLGRYFIRGWGDSSFTYDVMYLALTEHVYKTEGPRGGVHI